VAGPLIKLEIARKLMYMSPHRSCMLLDIIYWHVTRRTFFCYVMCVKWCGLNFKCSGQFKARAPLIPFYIFMVEVSTPNSNTYSYTFHYCVGSIIDKWRALQIQGEQLLVALFGISGSKYATFILFSSIFWHEILDFFEIQQIKNSTI
jgi:hypothetical protein